MPATLLRGAAALCLAALIGCAPTPRAGAPMTPAQPAAAAVRAAAHPLDGGPQDYDPLLALIGDARVVILGESTHGTREFYRERARITQRLVREKGFGAVVLEADVTPAARANRYVLGLGTDSTPEAALAEFDRFPAWMWRNTEMRDLVGWLREHNARTPAGARVGVYGMDLYGLYPAADAVVASLADADLSAATRAREAYACFEPYRPDEQRYGAGSMAQSCRDAARQVVREVERSAQADADDLAEAEARLSALRSARAVAGAEEFYRTMFAGGQSTWNVRDRHMAADVRTIGDHLRRRGRPPAIVVWAHNTHAGDARATEAGDSGDVTLGQLLREAYGDGAVLVGVFTYAGSVYAAPGWGEPARVYPLSPALPGSLADVFRASGVRRFVLPLRGGGPAADHLSRSRLQRAVGVVYVPAAERQAHYFTARPARQFDAVLFLDTTSALTPLPAD